MINIPQFKEQIEQKLQSENHDMKWLARKVKADEVALRTILDRKSMKYSTQVLKDVSKLLDIEIPKMEDEPIKTDNKPVPEPVQEEKPTLIDDMSEPLAEINEPVFWIDGQKYTKADVTRMIEDLVADHMKINELEEAYKGVSDQLEKLDVISGELKQRHDVALAEIDKLNKELQELTDKYMAKDKECMKYGIMVNDLHAEIDELKDAQPMELKDLTVEQAIQHYRALKRLFTDEVLQ